MAYAYIEKQRFIIGKHILIKDFILSLDVDPDAVYVTNNGRIVSKETFPCQNEAYHILPRVLGGKGGFGSMLRALGAQIEKTTNREACRDLSGRRMRDVNQEQELRDWVAKKAERERERAEKRKERAEKRKHALEGRSHKFEDHDYHSQKMKVLDQLDQALQQGLHKVNIGTAADASSTSALSQKRKSDDASQGPSAKKTCEWLGIDVENISDLDSDSDSSTSEDTSAPNTNNENQSTLESSSTLEKQPKIGLQKDKVTNERKQAGNEVSKKSPDTVKQGIHESQPESNLGGEENTNACKISVVKDGNKVLENQHTINQNLQVSESQTTPKCEGGPLNLEQYDSVSELEALGLDRLKSALTSIGLKCGGTLQQRAERLWSIKGKAVDKIDPKLLAKPARLKKK